MFIILKFKLILNSNSHYKCTIIFYTRKIYNKRITYIKTKDNVPSPSFIHYKNSIFYERGKTFNSNIASFVKGDFVYVISYRVPVSNKKFIFDIYNRENGDYITSIDVENGNKYCNRDIDNVVSDKQYIYLRIGENTFKLFVKQLDR